MRDSLHFYPKHEISMSITYSIYNQSSGCHLSDLSHNLYLIHKDVGPLISFFGVPSYRVLGPLLRVREVDMGWGDSLRVREIDKALSDVGPIGYAIRLGFARICSIWILKGCCCTILINKRTWVREVDLVRGGKALSDVGHVSYAIGLRIWKDWLHPHFKRVLLHHTY